MWKYIGQGSFLTGVPARDLSDDEFSEYAKAFKEREGVALEKTGLYVKADEKAAKTAKED